MKISRVIKVLLAASILISPFTYADWITKVDDDVFTGGHKAVMIGGLGMSTSSAILFDCTKGTASISYVEQDNSTDDIANVPMDLIVKIDGNPVIKLDAELSRRNANSVEVTSTEMEKITDVLKLLKSAKSKILVGIQTKDGGHQASFSGNASGSTNSVNSFVNACELGI